jgi:cell division protein FtsI (penicillin-binding protein 3)
MKPTLNVGDTEVINPQIARKENITKIQTALEHVVSQGLGKKAGTQLFKVAGKTGTSQIGEYYYGEESYVSEYQLGFCGYFPADKPKYSMIVSLNKLGLPASGGGMAGVVFHNVMEWMIAHGMFPLSIINETTRDTIRVTQNNIHAITDSLSKE